MKIRIIILSISICLIIILISALLKNNNSNEFPHEIKTSEREPSEFSTEVPDSKYQKNPVANNLLSNTSDNKKIVINSIVFDEERIDKEQIDPLILMRVDEERVMQVDLRASALFMAIKLYRKDFNKNPSGSSKNISATLMGENSLNKMYIDGYDWTDERGELIDPWGSPYSFVFEKDLIVVKSYGPNKSANDEDDIIYMRPY